MWGWFTGPWVGKLGITSLPGASRDGKGKEASKKISTVQGSSQIACSVKVGKQKVRSILDTGAELSLLSKHIFDKLKLGPHVLSRPELSLETVTGDTMEVHGVVNLDIQLGRSKINHSFYVTGGIAHSMILGFDFIKMNRLKLDFSQFEAGKLIINGEEIPLMDEQQVSSLIRLTRNITIPVVYW